MDLTKMTNQDYSLFRGKVYLSSQYFQIWSLIWGTEHRQDAGQET